MEILFKHGWLMFIIVVILNGLVMKFQSKKYIIDKPELKEGYDKYLKGWLIYGNIPWVIMAFGDLSGMTNNIFEYFNPKAMNPIVLIWHASIIILWILSIYWIYFNNGAEFIEQHPGIIKKSSFSGNSNMTTKQIKISYPLILLGGIGGMVMMWVMNIPTMQF